MSIQTKPIPVATQRRAAALPCDGVKRYKVGKKRDLSYSEAREAILEESSIGPNDRGGHILKRGTANRLADLNRAYFRVASEFVVAAVKQAQEQQTAAQLNGVVASPTPPEETVDDGGSVGTVVESSPEAQTATSIDLNTMEVGAKLSISCPAYVPPIVGTLSRNKSGFRCVIDGQEARSRNAAGIAKLISTALNESPWVTVKA